DTGRVAEQPRRRGRGDLDAAVEAPHVGPVVVDAERRTVAPPVDHCHVLGHQLTLLIARAGLPTATTPGGRLRVTTEPAPTTVSSPIVTPASTIAPPPSQTLSWIVMGSAASHFA